MNLSISKRLLQTPLPLSVLLVEPDPDLLASRALLLTCSNYVVATAGDHRTILELRWMGGIHLAVLSENLGLLGLHSAAECVRAKWPSARILILGSAPLALKDTLYDEAVDLRFQPKKLLDTLARLSKDALNQRPRAIGSNLGISTGVHEWLTFHRSKPPESDPTKARHLHMKEHHGQSSQRTSDRRSA